jgi:plasmid stabilization system protein ParE
MTSPQGFILHPGEAQDISDIWEFIAQENLVAAGRLREQILDSIRKLVPFPNQGHLRPDLTSGAPPLSHHPILFGRERRRLLPSSRRSPRVVAAILQESE